MYRKRPEEIVRGYFDIESEISQRKVQARQDFNIDYEEMFGDARTEDEQVLSAYYDLIDAAKDESGNFWYEDYRRLRDRYLRELAPDQRDYILRNTNMAPVPDRLLTFLATRSPNEYRRIRMSKKARGEHLRELGITKLLDR